MESIGEIVVPKNNRIELIIPDNFIRSEVEVLAFKIDKEADDFRGLKDSKDKSFSAVKLDLSNFKFNREEANER